MDINYFARGFLFGLLLGWLYLNTRRPPPERNDKILSPDFNKELQRTG